MEDEKKDRDEKGLFVEGTSIHRPSKLTDKFLDKMEEIMAVGIRAIIYTDEEAIEAVNELLDEKERMSMRTFYDHKKRITSSENIELTKEEVRFSQIIKRLLRQQKEGLFAKLGTDDKAWTRWAWIIERKFDDWNLRIKHQEVLDEEFNEVKKILNDLKEGKDV